MKLKHNLKFDLNENSLVFGDCKDWLPFIPDNSIDLIYIDPPFFSNKNYEIVWGNGYELRSFEDRFKGINHYASWMKDRLVEAHRVLKNTGSILLHCDWHANHHLRLLLDDLFGEENFINEIIWNYKTGGSSKRFLSRKHDNIYLFSKGNKYTYNVQKEKRYTKAKGRKPGVIDYGAGFAEFFKDEHGVYNLTNLSDVWEISYINSQAKERIGYKTQKPEKLLKKLLQCFSNDNDIILDFFGGGGTTAKACHDLGRRFITGDISPVAYRVMIDRLKEAGSSFKKVNPPLTRTEWLNINDKEFEKKICMFQGWTHNPTSKPVDGWTDKTKRIPVEIKNHTGQTGVGDIRKLAGAMAMAGQKQGVFVAWHYSNGCYEYVAQLEKKEKKKIDLVLAHTIIGELVLTKSQREEYQALYGERVKASKQQIRKADIQQERQKSKRQRTAIKEEAEKK